MQVTSKELSETKQWSLGQKYLVLQWYIFNIVLRVEGQKYFFLEYTSEFPGKEKKLLSQFLIPYFLNQLHSKSTPLRQTTIRSTSSSLLFNTSVKREELIGNQYLLQLINFFL